MVNLTSDLHFYNAKLDISVVYQELEMDTDTCNAIKNIRAT